MRVLISGSSGLIGSALARSLTDAGHTVSRLLRPQTKAAAVEGDVLWDLYTAQFDAQAAEGADAVVHLGGASIGEGRWTAARKALLQSSRVESTKYLVSQFAALAKKPGIFVVASAVGYFGNRGEEKLTDYSGPGDDFLARTCKDWEREAARAGEFGARVVTPRFGIVLSTQGGALPRMLLPIKLFVGGRIGSGKQWISWISLADTVGVLRLALENGAVRGAVNTVSPQPARNADFVKAAARALHRPAIFPAPAFALRWMFGEMADVLLLSSQRVIPDKLLKLGYEFQDAELNAALTRIITEKK